MTSDMERNLHSWYHDSTRAATAISRIRIGAHLHRLPRGRRESEVPDGWVDAKTGKQIEEDSVNYMG